MCFFSRVDKAAFVLTWPQAHNLSVFSLAAWALVDLRMEDTVEVYMDESAEIPCLYSFTEQPMMVMVQWFVVSPEISQAPSYFLI